MESDYILATDSSADLTFEYCNENNLPFVSISFTLDGVTRPDDGGKGMDMKELYTKLREGASASTAMVNTEVYLSFFEGFLSRGLDVLYLAFSSGLSGSYGASVMAAKEILKKYPDRRIIVVDTLCASGGQGVLVHKALKLKKSGLSLDELAAWAEERKLNINHLVTVDDLMHLHKGGRISKSSAIVGSIVGIKPLIDVDAEGKLRAFGKKRGRKQSIDYMLELMGELVESNDVETLFINHGDCIEDARYAADEARKRFNIGELKIMYIGPVIGCHTGAGVMTLFFEGKKRT